MNYTSDFKKRRDVVSFLFSKKNPSESNSIDLFYDFQVVTANLESTSGVKLNLDTRIISSYTNDEYTTWGLLSKTILSYIEQQSDEGEDYSSLNLHIRLRAPQRIYNILNYNKLSEYKFFDIIFSLNKEGVLVSTSAVEKSIPVIYPDPSAVWDQAVSYYIDGWRNPEPSINWDKMVLRYIDLWKSSNIKNPNMG